MEAARRLATPLAALDVPDAPRRLPDVAAACCPTPPAELAAGTAAAGSGCGRLGRGLERGFEIDARERLAEQRFLLVEAEELLGGLGDQPFGFLEPVGLDRIVDLAQGVPELDLFLVEPRRGLRRPHGVEARAQLAYRRAPG